MNRCSKTGLTDKDWKTILDIMNVFDPNDIAHVYPRMGTPEFMQNVDSAFRAVLDHVKRNIHSKEHVNTSTDSHRAPAIDHMTLQYQQWVDNTSAS